MSQKYSITSNPTNTNRRKSVFTPNLNNSNLTEASSQTIELERLEQEITLTLQTIDKSFSKSHKIINDKLIPIVKKYHANSKKIWTGVNFWKTFLEASANVELRGYEEAVQHEDFDNEVPIGQENALSENQSDFDDQEMRQNEDMSPVKVGTSIGTHTMGGDDVLMESTDYALDKGSRGSDLQSNPIMPHINQKNIGFDTSDSIIPSLPPVTVNLTNTNETDVNQTTPTLQQTESRHYVIHSNLDSTYKLQVSPRKVHKRASVVHTFSPNKAVTKKRKSFYQQKFDSSPFEAEPPQLRSDVQFSPVRRTSPLRKSQDKTSFAAPDEGETQRFPLTPKYGAGGNLLRTPGQVDRVAKRYSGKFQPDTSRDKNSTLADGFEDSEEVPNLSPPVTINFATVQEAISGRQSAQNMVKEMLNNLSGIDDSGATDNSLFVERVDKGQESLGDDFDAFLDKPERKPNDDNDWSE